VVKELRDELLPLTQADGRERGAIIYSDFETEELYGGTTVTAPEDDPDHPRLGDSSPRNSNDTEVASWHSHPQGGPATQLGAPGDFSYDLQWAQGRGIDSYMTNAGSWDTTVLTPAGIETPVTLPQD
jgi:hypothetical protein